MDTIVEKQEVLSVDNEKKNNIQLKEEIYQ